MGKSAREIRQSPEVREAIAKFTAKCRVTRPNCWICKQAIDYDLEFDPTSSEYFQVDHYYPISTHPQHASDITTFRPSHAGCNRQRSNFQAIELDNCSRDWEGIAESLKKSKK